MAPLKRRIESPSLPEFMKTYTIPGVALALIVFVLVIRQNKNRTCSPAAPTRCNVKGPHPNQSPLSYRKVEFSQRCTQIDPTNSQPGQSMRQQVLQLQQDTTSVSCSKKDETGTFAPISQEIFHQERPREYPFEEDSANTPLSDESKYQTSLCFPVPTDATIELLMSHVKRPCSSTEVGFSPESLASNGKENREERPFYTPALQSETMQIFLGAGLDRPRKWRRRILDYT
ncbi:hypothetical protein VTO42DRAFT_5593 [Malbranchea cinnamomea]